MREPLQIIYRRIEPSTSVENCVREQLVNLEACYGGIISCDVIIEPRGDGNSRDGGVHIRLDVGVPGLELDVDREAPGPQASWNIVGEVRSAFAEMQHRLIDYAQHADVRGPAESLRGRGLVSVLVAQENYGVISTAEGTEVYFHRDHVEGGAFDLLEVGSMVEFSAAPTLLGAQAVSVRIVG